MPAAWDRRRSSVSDHDPLRNLLDFNDVDTTAQVQGGALRNGFGDIIKSVTGVDVTGFVNLVQQLATGLLATPAAFLSSLIGGALEQVQDFLLAMVGGLNGRVTALEGMQDALGNPSQYDPFSRPTLDRWTNVVGELAITNSDYIQTPSFSCGFIGNTTDDIREPATDKHGVTFQISNKMAGICGGIFCADEDFTNYAAVQVVTDIWGNDTLRLVTGSSPTDYVVRTQTTYGLFRQLLSGATVAGYYDDITNAFYVLKNNVPVPELTWPDTDGIVTHGPTKRKVGIASNWGNTDFFGTSHGPGITGFSFQDKKT